MQVSKPKAYAMTGAMFDGIVHGSATIRTDDHGLPIIPRYKNTPTNRKIVLHHLEKTGSITDILITDR